MKQQREQLHQVAWVGSVIIMDSFHQQVGVGFSPNSSFGRVRVRHVVRLPRGRSFPPQPFLRFPPRSPDGAQEGESLGFVDRGGAPTFNFIRATVTGELGKLLPDFVTVDEDRPSVDTTHVKEPHRDCRSDAVDFPRPKLGGCNGAGCSARPGKVFDPLGKALGSFLKLGGGGHFKVEAELNPRDTEVRHPRLLGVDPLDGVEVPTYCVKVAPCVLPSFEARWAWHDMLDLDGLLHLLLPPIAHCIRLEVSSKIGMAVILVTLLSVLASVYLLLLLAFETKLSGKPDLCEHALVASNKSVHFLLHRMCSFDFWPLAMPFHRFSS